ncbi:hypothetical protein [uncultured Aquimarina sp.]|uniref:hypothetical protein n=1 Tax=uncultured Aquimarina sp. TaxID=575652 RepID=UPI00262BB842|nr:hypothetical protein [uncultured Aquimarina sp.]
MRSILLLVALAIGISGYGQVLSKTNIIFESNKTVVLNNGKEYKILKETPLYAISDTSIPLKHTVKEKTLILNRVLLIQEKDEPKELIEYIKGKMFFYELRDTKSTE